MIDTAIRSSIEADLIAKLGVTDWKAINYGILPNEDPKGYFQIVNVNPQSISLKTISVMVGIAVSADSLDSLDSQIVALLNSILEGYNNPRTCGGGLGRVSLGDAGINIEMPQSYSQQNNISTTTGFFTAITFVFEILQ